MELNTAQRLYFPWLEALIASPLKRFNEGTPPRKHKGKDTRFARPSIRRSMRNRTPLG